MVSTIRSAGCLAASIALRISAGCDTQPVEVSLCSTHTALILCSLSSRSFASITSALAPVRQSDSMKIGTSPSFAAMFFHSAPNWPVSYMSTWSPGESALTSEASQAPVPEEG